MKNEGLVILCCWLAVAALIGFVIGSKMTRTMSQYNAVNAGVAEYRVDEKGAVTFNFLECGGTETEP